MAKTMKSFQSNSIKACDEEMSIGRRNRKRYLINFVQLFYSNFWQKMSNH